MYKKASDVNGSVISSAMCFHKKYVKFKMKFSSIFTEDFFETNLQFDAGRNDDGSEAQRVRTDGGDHDRRHAGMDHGRAGRHRVSRTAGRGAHNQAVALDGRDVFAVQKQIDVGEIR